MAILIAGGDSFVWGNELADCTNEKYSLNTFPALVAQRMGLDYQCAAYPGASNNAIRRLMMDACEEISDIDFALVSWTFLGRYEFKFDQSWEQLSTWSIVDSSDEIKKYFNVDNPIIFDWHVKKLQRDKNLGIHQFAKVFYHYVGSFEYWELYNTLCEIVMLGQYLKLKNIPYIFTTADQNISMTKHFPYDATFKTLISQIDWNKWACFPIDLGFHDWAKQNNFPLGTTHPLEPAHVAAADILYERIRNLSRLP